MITRSFGLPPHLARMVNFSLSPPSIASSLSTSTLDQGAMLWTTPWPSASTLPTVLVICAVLAWWFTEPKSFHLNLVVGIGCLLFCWALVLEFPEQSFLFVSDKFEVLTQTHTKMFVTGAAVLWLFSRAWQTLRKPVPELIGILGVEVPDPPNVSLAGIRADAATLTWTRPRQNRHVAKFLIQVNGVNVGESANQETAITVTGLKPDHFYNVRVIAVGYNNNFQAGSRVIRLRTFARDGRPQLGDGRLPSNFVVEEQQLPMPPDHPDEDGVIRTQAASVETASITDTTTPAVRESPSNIAIARRNTLTRKHSPSTTSIDQNVKDALGKVPEASLQELGEKFQSIRKEIDETQAQILKDEKENKELMEELSEEKKNKRRILKEKDDTTERLKREMGSTDRAMRNAQQRKTLKEKQLKEKQNEWKKLEADIAKWEKEIIHMIKRQDGFDEDKGTIQDNGDARSETLRAEIAELQANLSKEEAELKEKGRELKEAEEQRKKLPGGEESEEFRERDRQVRRDWDMRARELHRRLYASLKRMRMAMDYESVLKAQLVTAQQSGLPFLYNQANTSGLEFEPSTPNQNRQSRNSNTMTPGGVAPSPAPSFTAIDRNFSTAPSFVPSRALTMPPGFPQAPFSDPSADISAPLDEEGIRFLTGGAPLSPTAAALLPAGMLDMVDDDEPPSPSSRFAGGNDGARPGTGFDNDPQSPASSGRSFSAMSSPRGSAHHLPFSQFMGENSDRHSLRGEFGATSPPNAPPSHGPKNRTFMPWFHRAPKPTDEPPALGSLKPNQSQSLPRSTEEPATRRRISFGGGWNMFNRNSAGPDLPDITGPSPRGLPSRRLGLSTNTNGGIISERDPSSPRPVSIASSELPRPSTDSGSIWGRPSHGSRFWSPEADPWNSRNPSRRPSIHGSPSALKTTLADADDEILGDSDIMHASPSQVGVIGSRTPMSKASLSQRLNPAAPTFMAGFFRGKADKDKDLARDQAKSKGKEKEVFQEKKPRESLTSVSEAAAPSVEESPSDSRKSRDALSVSTQSVTESRESLSLENPSSNTPSDSAAGVQHPEQVNSFKKLLRKGSSSKFSLSSVRGLSAKKGPGSVSNSDKNLSLERTSFDEYAEDSSAAGTPIGRGFDSPQPSPSLGPTSARSSKDKSGAWARFGMKKKAGKERDSLDIERTDFANSPVAEED